jgi:tryptophanyl-tRNA synthetase
MLYRLFATQEQIEEVKAIYLRGGFGYGDIKKRLADAADAYLEPSRQRRAQFESNPKLVDDILRDGAKKGREVASKVLARAEKACGI